MEQEKIISVIESILFVSGEPLKKNKICKILEIKNEDLEKILENLDQNYSQVKSGFSLLRKGEEIQLVSKADNAEFVEKLFKSEMQDSISSAALEVVSIITYRGPISKAEIEQIRGVNCSYTLRNLLMRGLIEKTDNPRDSRGYNYSISFDFLKKMGISDVKNLPDYATLSVDSRLNEVMAENSKVEEDNKDNNNTKS